VTRNAAAFCDAGIGYLVCGWRSKEGPGVEEFATPGDARIHHLKPEVTG